MVNVLFDNANSGHSMDIAVPSENEVGLACIDMSPMEFCSPTQSSSSSPCEYDLSSIVYGDTISVDGSRCSSGMAVMSRPVEVVSILMARSKNSALLLERRKVQRYSSSFFLYPSASSLELAVTQRSPMKVPTTAKQYFDEEYQKD